MEKKSRIIVLIFILLLAGIIAFVFISNRAEAPTGEKSPIQFKGPEGEPYVRGPITPSPIIKN